LLILYKSTLAIYDLKKGQYIKLYSYINSGVTDIALLDKNTVLLLSKKTINKYKIN